jgi:hypothetical protein
VIITVIILVLLCFSSYFSSSEISIEEADIDIVYTWVSYDEELRKQIEKFNSKIDSSDPKRFVSSDELKYSLRGLETYANWFHKIYIVVHDHQKPTWLKETDKLKIIKHSDIIPKKYLPTFNSLCIESLSE